MMNVPPCPARNRPRGFHQGAKIRGIIDPKSFAKQGIDVAVQFEFSKGLIDQLSFEQWIVALDKNGRPIFESTPPDATDWKIRDGGKQGQPGLVLRVTRGALTWCVQRKLNGKTKVIAMARARKSDDYTGRVLSLAEARTQARAWLVAMEEGVDPRVYRERHQAEMKIDAEERRLTMGVAFADFIEAKRKHKIKLDGAPLAVGVGQRRQVDAKLRDASTEDRIKVQRWMDGSPMWSVPLKALTKEQVSDSLTPLLQRAAGHKVALRWGPKSVSKGTMDKIYRHLDAAWFRAIKKLAPNISRDQSPFQLWREDHTSDWPRDKHVDSALDTKSDAHVAWLRALLDMQKEAHDPAVFTKRASTRSKDIKPHLAAMVDWYFCLILWGTRATETQLLEWAQVDFERKLVWLSDETTKSGAIDVVPLTPWAIQLLQERQRLNELWRPEDPGKYVFPSREHGRPISSPRGVLTALEEKTGIRLTAHDLRRSLARELGSDDELVETARLLVAGAALHHGAGKGGSKIAGATRRYLEDKANTLRPLFQKRENRLREILGLPVEKAASAGLDVEAVLDRLRQDPAFLQQIMAAALQAR